MKTLQIAIITCISIIYLSCGGSASMLQAEEELKKLEELSFGDFIDESYFSLLRTYPELVTELGMDEALAMNGTELNSYNEDFLLEREKLEREILSSLRSFDQTSMNDKEKLSYSVYEAYLTDLVNGQKYRHHEYLLSYMLTSVNVATEQFFSEILPVTNLEDAEKYIERLRAVGPKMEEVDQQMQRQEEIGIILPEPILQATLRNIRSISRKKASNTSFYLSFLQKLEKIDLEQKRKEALLVAAEEACESSVLRGYGILEKRLLSQQEKAPSQTGVAILPDGENYYSYTLSHHTNSSMTPDEIHQKGIMELEFIHEEMRRLFDGLEYKRDKSISELYNDLKREDSTVSGEQVVEAHRELLDLAKGWMEDLFLDFPDSEVLVKKDRQGGYYIPPSFDGSRRGTFFASTGSVSSFTLPTLTFHETYPGHHYQIALAGEMDLPFFRRQAIFTGYLEGWALYSEYLMDETGFYEDDPYGRLGYLQASAFRAARLVVDTGLHLYGWDINKAIAFFADNTGFSRSFAGNQVYRYLVWPGQAASYYTGFLEFKNLLEGEKDRLGTDFDYRQFHKSILSGGPMPLTLLKKEVFSNE